MTTADDDAAGGVWQQPPLSASRGGRASRQGSAAPLRSAERRRSRFSDVREPDEAARAVVAAARSETDGGGGGGGASPPSPPLRTVTSRYLTAEPSPRSQSTLSDSSQTATTTSMPTVRSQASTAASPRGAVGRATSHSPQRNPARDFQARPRKDVSADDGAKSLTIPPIVRKTLMDFDRVQKLKFAAEKAIRDKKVFMIHGGYPSIRLALKRRGWVEKKYMINKNEPDDDIDVSRWPIDDVDDAAAALGLSDVLGLKGSKNSTIITRLLRDNQPNLIWSAKREVIDYINLERDQLVNHFQRAPFNTKIGLCTLAQGLHWYSESLPADTFIPRAYRIGVAEEKQEFVDDYRLTACVSLLVWFRERYELHGTQGVEDADGEVPYSVIPTALQQCQVYMSVRLHEDIEPGAFNRALWPHQWDSFMTNVYKIIHKKKKLERHRDENSTIVKVFYNRIVQLLQDLGRYRPQTRLDGCLNIWIVKPGSASRGRGIVLMRQLEDILALVDSATQREGKYVVQKYCERPMLIYNTKFDIRQWFLVTDWNPLTVWMYKQSYLRFSSQQFDLNDLKEAIHLCNNAVQARYRNGERHAALPTENMWDASTFQQFLKSREAGHAWDQIIYPNMKNAVISICLAAQTELEPRKGCFELFGADFLLTEDYHPWLIEVNSSPAMGATTSVTAWLCAMCLEDTIRVIVDRRKDAAADVGEFECILHQPPVSSPRYLGIDLSIHGHRIKAPTNQPAPAAAEPTPPQPARGPTSQPSVRDVSRLNSIPSSQSMPVTSRASLVRAGQQRRSVSQTPSVAASNSSRVGGAKEQPRRRSQSQAPRRVGGGGGGVSGSGTAAAATDAATIRPPRQKIPTAAAGGGGKRGVPPTAARRRSRTQLIQTAVRRLSAPRRPHGQVRQKMAAVAASLVAADNGGGSGSSTPAGPARPRPSASVPRSPLPNAGRAALAASPRAQQLVTAGRSATDGDLLACLQDRPGPVASESRVLSGRRRAKIGRGGAPHSATGLQPSISEPSHVTTSATAEGQACQNYITSSLEKLEKIRASSEAAVQRITSLSLVRTAAAPADPPTNAAALVQPLEVTQTGKVKWVAMSTIQVPEKSPTGSGTAVAAPAVEDTSSRPTAFSHTTVSSAAGKTLSAAVVSVPLRMPPPLTAVVTSPPAVISSTSSVITSKTAAVSSNAEVKTSSTTTAVTSSLAVKSWSPSAKELQIAASGALSSTGKTSSVGLTWAPAALSAAVITPRNTSSVAMTVAAAAAAAAGAAFEPGLPSPAVRGLRPTPLVSARAPPPAPISPPSWGSPTGGCLSPLTPAAAATAAAAAAAAVARGSSGMFPLLPPTPYLPSVSGRLPVSLSTAAAVAATAVRGGGSLSPTHGGLLLSSGRTQQHHQQQQQQQQQAFNMRIIELKGLIDRAIDETREFLGRGRPTASAAAAATKGESPRPVRQSSAATAAAVVPADVTGPGSSCPASGNGLTSAEPRLTELVGLHGRRFLPQLNASDPLPRRSR